MSERVYQSSLNPVIWQPDGNIKSEIAAKLLKIASDFYAEVKIKAGLKDVLLLGSSANYNWTPTSDIDIHLVIDVNELGVDQSEVQNYLNALNYLSKASSDTNFGTNRIIVGLNTLFNILNELKVLTALIKASYDTNFGTTRIIVGLNMF